MEEHRLKILNEIICDEKLSKYFNLYFRVWFEKNNKIEEAKFMKIIKFQSTLLTYYEEIFYLLLD